MLVIIDSPDFTHRVARERVRAGNPAIPVVDYVSPSVWAWRPGRARAMLGYVDHVLGLLPFKPEEYQQAARTAMQLCRPSPDRAIVGAATECGGADATRDRSRRCSWYCPAAAAARSGIIWTYSAQRSAGCRPKVVAFAPMLPTMPHLEATIREGVGELAGQAADRGWRSREARRLPDCACSAREIRHGDPGAGTVGHSDGDGLSRQRGRKPSSSAARSRFPR